VTSGGFSSRRLARVRDGLSRHLDAGYVPGAVAVVARRGEIYIEAMGKLAFEGAGSRTPMAADTICRIGSMTKPVVAACAMTLVEDGTAGARAARAADLDRLLDGRLPGDRRLTAAGGRRVQRSSPLSGPVAAVGSCQRVSRSQP
jgi:Beta-lactamase